MILCLLSRASTPVMIQGTVSAVRVQNPCGDLGGCVSCGDTESLWRSRGWYQLSRLRIPAEVQAFVSAVKIIIPVEVKGAVSAIKI